MKIIAMHDCNGTLLPVGTDRRYLDWTQIHKDQAPLPHSPYGHSEFHIGDNEFSFVPEWFKIPDGRYIMDAFGGYTEVELDSPMRDIPLDDLYWIVSRNEIAEIGWNMTERMLGILESYEIKHDAKWWRADPWYFFRTLAKEAKLKPYNRFTKEQLRTGR